MEPNKIFAHMATEDQIQKTVASLTANGFVVAVTSTSDEAKKKIFEILPKGAEVLTMTSVTLDTIGLTSEINDSGAYVSLRKKIMALDRNTQGKEMAIIGAAPDWSIGSAHAVTEDGQLLIASATGSQLPAESYGAGNVIFVVGIQKIVSTLEDGIKRIYEYSLPLENVRAQKAYGMQSSVNKILIINREFRPERIHVIFVKENLGF